MKKLILVDAAIYVLVSLASASAIGLDSLWISNNNASSLPVLNTDRNGNLLRQISAPVQATGIAIDPLTSTLFIGGSSATITPRDLGTLSVNGPSFTPASFFPGDMAFDGTSLWRINTQHKLEQINPTTGAFVSTIPFTLAGAATYGLAWDGTNFWISQIGFGGLILQITPAGNFTGLSFHVSSSFRPGGLAFDTTDNTLFIGADNAVYHYDLAGNQLGMFAVSGQGYIDGLEFQPINAVPEQSSAILLVFGALGLLAIRLVPCGSPLRLRKEL